MIVYDDVKYVAVDNLIPGRWYRVILDDCCIWGRISGEFFKVIGENNPDDEGDLLFSFGVIGGYEKSLKFIEIPGHYSD